jgi:hypothetical protein
MRVLFLLTIIVPLSACSFYDRQEYRIVSPSRADVTRVREILRDVAAQGGIPKNVGGYHSDGEMIGWYNQRNVDLHATWHRGVQIDRRQNIQRPWQIDIELSRSDWPSPLAFRRAYRLLTPALSSAFGRRLEHPPRALPGEATAERIISVY